MGPQAFAIQQRSGIFYPETTHRKLDSFLSVFYFYFAETTGTRRRVQRAGVVRDRARKVHRLGRANGRWNWS